MGLLMSREPLRPRRKHWSKCLVISHEGGQRDKKYLDASALFGSAAPG